MIRPALSPRRTEVLDAVKALTAKRGIPPTQWEIAQSLDMSRSTVRQHLVALSNAGLLRMDPKARRSIVVVPAKRGRGKTQ